MKIKLPFLMLAIVIIFGNVNCYAFSVQNKTNIYGIHVEETSGGIWLLSFKQVIDPGQTKSCHWSNKGCNASEKKDAILKFDVFYDICVGYGCFVHGKKYICKNFSIRADGDIVIKTVLAPNGKSYLTCDNDPNAHPTIIGN